MSAEVICNEEVVASVSGGGYVIATKVENIVGECYIKANVAINDWYPMFSISVYSSEVLHMDEAELDCEDHTKSNG